MGRMRVRRRPGARLVGGQHDVPGGARRVRRVSNKRWACATHTRLLYSSSSSVAAKKWRLPTRRTATESSSSVSLSWPLAAQDMRQYTRRGLAQRPEARGRTGRRAHRAVDGALLGGAGAACGTRWRRSASTPARRAAPLIQAQRALTCGGLGARRLALDALGRLWRREVCRGRPNERRGVSARATTEDTNAIRRRSSVRTQRRRAVVLCHRARERRAIQLLLLLSRVRGRLRVLAIEALLPRRR